MAKSLRKAEVDVLVVQTGRELERAARELIPEDRDPEGKPLMLGPRMYRLRDQLDDEAWQAYQAWAAERNAYVHGQTDSLKDRDAFFENYKIVLDELEALNEVEEDQSGGITNIVIFIIALVVGLMYAC